MALIGSPSCVSHTRNILIQVPLGHRNWPEWLLTSEGTRLGEAGADEPYRVGRTRPLPPFVVPMFSFLSDLKTTSAANLGVTGKAEPQWSQLRLPVAMILTLMLGLGGYLSLGLLGAWAQDPGTRFSDPKRLRVPAGWKTETADTSRDPIGR